MFCKKCSARVEKNLGEAPGRRRLNVEVMKNYCTTTPTILRERDPRRIFFPPRGPLFAEHFSGNITSSQREQGTREMDCTIRLLSPSCINPPLRAAELDHSRMLGRFCELCPTCAFVVNAGPGGAHEPNRPRPRIDDESRRPIDSPRRVHSITL